MRSATTPARLLITGGSGLLGLNWAAWARARCRVTLGLHNRNVVLGGVESARIDLDTSTGIRRVLDRVAPDLVVHAAGLTSVEACEADPDAAWRANVEISENVARACAETGVRLVHISTDHLFSGDLPFHVEEEPPDPLNAYACSKAEAEVRVLAANGEALVVRTNIFAWGPSYRRSFSDTILQALRDERPISLFDDVFFTPILVELLAAAVHELATSDARGILHVSGDERVSKLEFGRRLSQHFELNPRPIRPSQLADNSALVRRPREMSLSNLKARELLGRPLGGIDAQLRILRDQERQGLTAELLAL
jgi:dTDP-4-dehydrorhamnose reductase